MVYIVYVIRCAEGKYYIGYTSNLSRRLRQHNNGESRWTSNYSNWQLVYREDYESKSLALKREKFLKRMKKGDVFRKIINIAG